MQSKRAWLVYVLVRLLAFAIPFAVIMLALRGWPYDWVAAGAAGALISLLVSYIFLRQHRTRMGADLRALRSRRDPRGELELEEDAELGKDAEPDETGNPGDEAGDDEADGHDTSPKQAPEPGKRTARGKKAESEETDAEDDAAGTRDPERG